ncbi:MAG: pyruvate formate-lyase-activating protein [Defluviitaleaceae bacterium]|nr:pyruvate formate-lyase-activating protein [Defluviitaleaceae bacterium]
MMVIGKVHSIETCGTVDGPGIRYAVFLQGCPLRCIYCHNPDTWPTDSKTATEISVEEIVRDIVKYKSYFKFSGGGMTLTGGEPLMQKAFCKEVFKACQTQGIHTALDTSGCYKIDEHVAEILSYTDLVLLDIKTINPARFLDLAGIKIDNTLAFAQYLNDNNIPVWIRFVQVPGHTNITKEMHDLAQYVCNLKNVDKFSVLPFHQLGAYKWADMGLDYKLQDTKEPTKEETENLRNLFRSYGLDVI